MLKKLRFFPPVTAWISAAFLYGLLLGLGTAGTLALPHILQLFEDGEARLAIACVFALVASPAVVVAIFHHATSGVLDRLDRGNQRDATGSGSPKARGILPGVQSWWAGVLGCFIFYGVTTLTTFILLFVHPPESDGEHVASVFALVTSVTHLSDAALASAQSALWLALAAQFYNLERRARKAGA